MDTKKLLKLYAAAVLILFSGFSLKAQNAQDAVNKYNWAIKNYKKDINAAIDSLERFEEISDTLLTMDELGDDNKEKIKQLQAKSHRYLPIFYYKSAVTLYKQRRTDMAIDRFKETIAVAKKFENEDYLKKAEDLLPKLYKKSASDAMMMMDYQKAITMYNQALAIDSNQADVLLDKAQVYSKDDNNAMMIKTLQEAIAVAEKSGDDKTRRNAVRMAQTYYWRIGANAVKNANYEDALSAFNKALEFDPQEGYAYYYVALAKNNMSLYDEAIDDAEKGISLMDPADKEELAMLQLELGKAYALLSKVEKGCEYLKKAEQNGDDDTELKARKEQESFNCSNAQK
ncbi:MAG: tetratricopeptide repeat protein [Bacteroidales bacterium]